jgi:hypothetical protein
MGKLVQIVAGLLSIGAGIYLLTMQSVGVVQGGESWLQVLAHGIGVYFIARGLWMLASREDTVVARLDRLVELGALDHQARVPIVNAAEAPADTVEEGPKRNRVWR